MYWTLELASKLEDAPWPATKDELIDYAMRSGAPMEVVENLQEIEDEGEPYDSIEDLWPDYPKIVVIAVVIIKKVENCKTFPAFFRFILMFVWLLNKMEISLCWFQTH
jgi:hypothetical protein